MNKQRISELFPFISACLSILGFGPWLLFWVNTWPPSTLQINAAVLGMIVGLIYCLDRMRNWDVHTWAWRDPRRQKPLSPLFRYGVPAFSGVVGLFAARIIYLGLGLNILQALIPLMGAVTGLIFLWGTVEAIKHIAYLARFDR